MQWTLKTLRFLSKCLLCCALDVDDVVDGKRKKMDGKKKKVDGEKEKMDGEKKKKDGRGGW